MHYNTTTLATVFERTNNAELTNGFSITMRHTKCLLRRTRAVLIDGNSVLYGAYYGTPSLHSANKGEPVNAVYTTLRTILKHVAEVNHAAVCWDRPEPTFRHELLPNDYKANRSETPADLKPQFNLAKEAVAALGIQQYERAGFEADDLLATLSYQLSIQHNCDIHLISADKDLLQLVRHGNDCQSESKECEPYGTVRLLHPFSKVGIRDVEHVRQEWGVEPEQLPALFAMVGDAADNVKGVTGIGKKIGSLLLQEHHDLIGILQATKSKDQSGVVTKYTRRGLNLMSAYLNDGNNDAKKKWCPDAHIFLLERIHRMVNNIENIIPSSTTTTEHIKIRRDLVTFQKFCRLHGFHSILEEDVVNCNVPASDTLLAEEMAKRTVDWKCDLMMGKYSDDKIEEMITHLLPDIDFDNENKQINKIESTADVIDITGLDNNIYNAAMMYVPACWRTEFERQHTDEKWRNDMYAEIERNIKYDIEHGCTKIYPSLSNIFACFRSTPLDDVRVIIVGQDPYHGQGQADGHAFSVQHSSRNLPPSLLNILKESNNTEMIEKYRNGQGGLDQSHDQECDSLLEKWANQGVLLLNSTLTVRAGEANSHQHIGWQTFTGGMLDVALVHHKNRHLVFLCWGKNAENLVSKAMERTGTDKCQHAVIKTSHPSPLSAHRSTQNATSFIDSKCFEKTNEVLDTPIDWNLFPSDL